MGASVSTQIQKSYSTNLTKLLTENVTNTYVSATNDTTSNQNLTIKNVSTCGKGDITISDISQKAYVKYNFDQLVSTTNETQVKSQIENAIKAAMETTQTTEAQFLGGPAASVSTQITEIVNNNAVDIATKVYNDIKSSIVSSTTNNQNLGIIDVGTLCGPNGSGDITIDNITQSFYLDSVIKQAANAATQQVYDTLVTNSTDIAQKVTQDTTSSGLTDFFSSIGGIVTAVVIGIAVLALISGMAYIIYKKKKEQSNASSMPPVYRSLAYPSAQ